MSFTYTNKSCSSIYIFWFCETSKFDHFCSSFQDLTANFVATLLGALHKRLRPDNPALQGRKKPHLGLFINVKMYHPSRPIVLKAASVQENLSKSPYSGLRLRTRAFSIWVSCSPPQKKSWNSKKETSLNMRMCIVPENM